MYNNINSFHIPDQHSILSCTIHIFLEMTCIIMSYLQHHIANMIVQCIFFKNCIINKLHKLIISYNNSYWKLKGSITKLHIHGSSKKWFLYTQLLLWKLHAYHGIAMLIVYYIDHQDNNYTCRPKSICI